MPCGLRGLDRSVPASFAEVGRAGGIKGLSPDAGRGEGDYEKKLKVREPFWVSGSLILDEDVDGKGGRGAGWDGAVGARRTSDVGC